MPLIMHHYLSFEIYLANRGRSLERYRTETDHHELDNKTASCQAYTKLKRHHSSQEPSNNRFGVIDQVKFDHRFTSDFYGDEQVEHVNLQNSVINLY